MSCTLTHISEMTTRHVIPQLTIRCTIPSGCGAGHSLYLPWSREPVHMQQGIEV